MTSAGPFGDPEWTTKLFDFVHKYGAATICQHLEHVASGATGSGDAEHTLRWQYAQVGLLALWLGRIPLSELPESLRAQVPSPPAADLASCAVGARAIVDQIAGRESELRMIWGEAPDGGAAFRASIAALRAVFPD